MTTMVTTLNCYTMAAPVAGRGSSASLRCYSTLFKNPGFDTNYQDSSACWHCSSQSQQFPSKPWHTHFSILYVLRLSIVCTSFTSFSFHISPKKGLCPLSAPVLLHALLIFIFLCSS